MMGICNRTLAARLFAAGFLSCAGLFPMSSSALMLGEITLHSYLGQALRATVEVRSDAGEQVDGSCFSLTRPGQQDDFTYLTQARLALQEANGRMQLVIHSQQAIGEPFFRLMVQANCGQGRFQRVFTILLDPVETVAPVLPARERPVTAAPQVATRPAASPGREVQPGETLHSIATALFPRQARMQRKMVRALRNANPDLRDISEHAELPPGSVIHIPVLKPVRPPVMKPEAPVQTLARGPAPDKLILAKPDKPLEKSPPVALSPVAEGGFRLKLSNSELDLSVLGKLTDEQRQHLREKQRLLDADDQVANTLSMKNRIMQLEAEIDEMRAALAQTNKHLAMNARQDLPAVSKPVQASSSGQSDNGFGGLEGLSLRVMAVVGMVLVLLGSAWWWHRRRTEARREARLNQDVSSHEVETSASQLLPEQSSAEIAPEPFFGQDDELYHDVTGIFHTDESVTLTEADTVLDEAELYLAYGWVKRAIDLLLEYLEKHPDDVQLWKKLFEIYHAEGMIQAFEQLALRCQVTMDDSALWVLVQKLGRQIDAGNALYLSSQDVVNEAAEVEAPAGTDVAPTEFVLPETTSETPPIAEVSADEAETVEIEVPVKSEDTLFSVPQVPALDVPLEFVFDEKPLQLPEIQEDSPEPPEAAQENEDLAFAPLFPETMKTTREAPKDDSGTNKS